MRAHRAFSLLELLTALAIIALLISIAMPAMSGVRRTATSARCLNNMRSLGVAHFTYVTDHRFFIDAGLPHNNLGDPENAWINTLEPYYDNDVVVRSPLDDSPHWDESPIAGTTDRYRVTSYGLNNYLTKYSPYQLLENSYHDRLNKIKSAASTVHFLIMAFEEPEEVFPGVESGFPGSDHVHVENWSADPPVLAATQVQTDAVRGQLRSWAAVSNYGFLDGHTETLQFGEVFFSHHDLSNEDEPGRNRFDPEVSWRWAMQVGGS